MNIYVGNLAYGVTEEMLTELFSQFGEVASAKIITDRDSGRSKGFGFVEIEDDSSAENAIESLNGNDFEGRNMVVNQARPKPSGGSGGGYRGGGGGGNRW